MKKIYFIANDDSSRSQIAKGFAQKDLPIDWEVHSAGIEKGSVNPRAVAVMAENGIDIYQTDTAFIDINYYKNCDIIVTLCGEAQDNLPDVKTRATIINWDIPNPVRCERNDAERILMMRLISQKIATKVQKLANKLVKTAI